MEEGLEKGLEKGMEKGLEKGMEKGLEKGILVSIRNLMKSMGWPAEQAMKALQIPEVEQPTYTAALKEYV